MVTKVILTFTEVSELVAAVLAYNGRTAVHLNFLDSSGVKSNFDHLEIDCEEASGLVVRVAPEAAPLPEENVRTMMAREMAMIHG